MNTPQPEHINDEAFANLVDRGMLPARGNSEPHGATPEHPTASWLFRKWRVGSAILTKDEAYKIANELNRLYLRNTELEANRIAAATQVASCIESLGSRP